MRTTKLMAIALIALATSAATEQTQAQGELEYAENLFAIVWYEDRPVGKKSENSFKLLHWPKSVGAPGNSQIETRSANWFDKDKEHVEGIHYSSGLVTLAKGEIGNGKDDSVVFYIQVADHRTFFPERALKVELFHNRRIAIITHEDTGFRRMVPVQRYQNKTSTSSIYEKEPRTAINFGPIK